MDSNAMHIGQNSSARDLVLQSNEKDGLTIKGSDQSVQISGSLVGGTYSTIEADVDTTSTYTFDVNSQILQTKQSGTTIKLSMDSSNSTGTNQVRIELPNPGSYCSGAHFKIVFRTLGSSGTNTTRPIRITMGSLLGNAIMPRITGGLNSGTSGNGIGTKESMYSRAFPCEAIEFSAGKAAEGDQLECYSDGERWYLSGFVSGSDLQFIT